MQSMMSAAVCSSNIETQRKYMYKQKQNVSNIFFWCRAHIPMLMILWYVYRHFLPTIAMVIITPLKRKLIVAAHVFHRTCQLSCASNISTWQTLCATASRVPCHWRFSLVIKINGNFPLVSCVLWQSNRDKILHTTRQQCCRVICENV